ncbi:hypothetical protein HRW18_28035 [Streptomyces lunaelactis]|uniref:hypothetical protein n=1 Tax=Streptomyces lunaelactis TaxID=1535768 RepID=UPI0015849299|nr:hypothetical protein [Streptomyces lunaelactis]NUK11757.1 hypothetical protein [Streptomyces lunaelactis]NUL12824.1 hypothetical protein [Streptomyces lunaelactis]NUL25945.1 hypothetical protein [Streptomyces lunaelactis]
MRPAPPGEQIAALLRLQTCLTRVLVAIAFVALVFTATNVTLFAIDHHISVWIAWLLDPMVAVALGTVLIVDGVLSQHGVHPSGWATALRWFAGLSTWLMNCWAALWPAGSPFGIPRDVDPAGLVLHSIPPVLLIVLAEAITHYRRAILARIAELRPLVNEVDSNPVHSVSTPRFTPAPAAKRVAAETPELSTKRLVICGGQKVYPLTVPPASTPDRDSGPDVEKLPADQAMDIIRTCWLTGDTIAQAAVKSTRSTSYVHKVYKRLQESADNAITQLALTGADSAGSVAG